MLPAPTSAAAEPTVPAPLQQPTAEPLPPAPLQSPSSASSYVRLRGLPFVTTEQEVAQWFGSTPGGPISVLRVIFTFNAYGRKSGEAFVEMPEAMGDQAVQLLNHRHLGSRYIEVFLSSESEASQAQTAPNAQQGASGSTWAEGNGAPASNGIVRLRGLPFNVTQDAIMQFFQGYHIPNGAMAVHLVLGTNSRPNGEAFVEFGSEEAADAALAKDRASIGTRYVEVFRSNLEQMHQALSRANKSNNLAPVQMQMGMGAGSGMPYAPYPTFSPMGPPMYGGAMGAPGGMGVVDSVVKMRGLPYKVTRNDILEFFVGLSVPLNGVHLMFNEREQPTGEAYVEFSSPEDRERAMSKDRQHMGGRYVELFRVSRAEMIQALEQFVGGYMSNSLQMHGAPPPYGMYGGPYSGSYSQPAGFAGMQPPMGGPGYAMGAMPGGMPGHPGGGKAGTLRMRGLPFRATVDDVYRFFNGFHVLPGGIVLGQRDGRPSGEAWVTFSSPAEAQRALGMNHKNMGSRYVELFAAS